MNTPIPVVDIFSGPGGLGEGFSAVRKGGKPVYKIVLSAEMDVHAHRTLLLRAFFRKFRKGRVPQSYYDYVHSDGEGKPWTEQTRAQWEQAEQECQLLELGDKDADKEFDRRLKAALKKGQPWVLIGGPPCQAYSVAGRVRNNAKEGYTLSKDPRTHLYKEYLRIVKKFKPSVFVMENVKGLISAKIETGGGYLCQQIIKDLRYLDKPEHNKNGRKNKEEYSVHSLVIPSEQEQQKLPLPESSTPIHPRDFLIKSEEYDIPQKRHRIVMVGIRQGRNGIDASRLQLLQRSKSQVNIEHALVGLPSLRSGLSRGGDSTERWVSAVGKARSMAAQNNALKNHADTLKVSDTLQRSNRQKATVSKKLPKVLADWYFDPKLKRTLNHTTRGHMEGDIQRYMFAALFTLEHGYPPKTSDFPRALVPKHTNWESGKFVDRYKVQKKGQPADTITSHIGKDGHYFIHYDPKQCRSLTVREAARIQTFPDNYYFCGPRTEQYKQVGNAVPPLLAREIAQNIEKLLIE